MRLTGKVVVVTGASRGVGRGIAVALGAEGATVYLSGRTMDATGEGLGGSLRQTAEWKAVVDRAQAVARGAAPAGEYR